MVFDYGALREHWYRQGWFTERTCLDAFTAGAADHGSSPVTFLADDSAITATVSEIHRAAVGIAAGLQRLGVRVGDAVAVQLTNRVECAVAYQAVLLCGAVLVPIVHIYGIAEVSFILAESRAKAVIMPERWLDQLCRKGAGTFDDLNPGQHCSVGCRVRRRIPAVV